jgi:hypothetical protein
LVKSVTCQVVTGRPSQVVRQTRGLASTDFQLRIPCYRLLESVTIKPTRERLQSAADRPGDLASWPPLGPLVSNLCTLPPHVRYIPRVTLILVEF